MRYKLKFWEVHLLFLYVKLGTRTRLSALGFLLVVLVSFFSVLLTCPGHDAWQCSDTSYNHEDWNSTVVLLCSPLVMLLRTQHLKMCCRKPEHSLPKYISLPRNLELAISRNFRYRNSLEKFFARGIYIYTGNLHL